MQQQVIMSGVFQFCLCLQITVCRMRNDIISTDASMTLNSNPRHITGSRVWRDAASCCAFSMSGISSTTSSISSSSFTTTGGGGGGTKRCEGHPAGGAAGGGGKGGGWGPPPATFAFFAAFASPPRRIKGGLFTPDFGSTFGIATAEVAVDVDRKSVV